MAAEKVSVTVDADLMKWARSAAKKRGLTFLRQTRSSVAPPRRTEKSSDVRTRQCDRATFDTGALIAIERRNLGIVGMVIGKTDLVKHAKRDHHHQSTAT